ncbi:hypothetical protein PACTADRAFT_49908 [Pachysolen tannophilus NRRL Y-2460]|uniref:Uncharacterized protein n=1 Tax=Pachysolen tannophilus NRRL Y-2460 TaxID=669874 RepID=A0A1E4TTT2_PACTA|nr:hypothetical protein PACTADRAFT_49908 [Pachysolen tannophilus NRRL Y-2460]
MIRSVLNSAAQINDDYVSFTPKSEVFIEKLRPHDFFNVLPARQDKEVEDDLYMINSNDDNFESLDASLDKSKDLSNEIFFKKVRDRLVQRNRDEVATNTENKEFNVTAAIEGGDEVLTPPETPTAVGVENNVTTCDVTGSLTANTRDSADASSSTTSSVGTTFSSGVGTRVGLNLLSACLRKGGRKTLGSKLYDKLYADALLILMNSVDDDSNHQFEETFANLNEQAKFKILEIFLNDNQLIDDFRQNYKYNHGFNQKAREEIWDPPFNNSLKGNLLVKIIARLIITICKILFYIAYPFIQLLVSLIVEINDQYNISGFSQQIFSKCLIFIAEQIVLVFTSIINKDNKEVNRACENYNSNIGVTYFENAMKSPQNSQKL